MRQSRGTAPTDQDRPPRPRPAHAGPRADERALDERAPDGRTGDTRTADEARGSAAAARSPRPFLLRLRPRTVRARIVSLLMVPVVSLMALWGFAAVTTAQNVDALVRAKQLDMLLLTPVAGLVGDLQAERTAAADFAAAPGQSRAQALQSRGRATDSALSTLDQGIAAAAADTAGLSADLPARLDALRTAGGALPALRGRVLGGALGWSGTMAGYDAVVATAFDLDAVLAGARSAPPGSDPRVLLELARADDLLAREDAAVQSAQLAGRMSPDQYQEFTGAAYGRRVLADAAANDLRPQDRAAYLAVARGRTATALQGYESVVRGSGTGPGALHQLSPKLWSATAAELGRQYAAVESAAGAGAAAAADPYSLGVFTRNGAAVLFGLLAVLLSLLISVRIGRRLVVELVDLRDSALDLAGRRLPEAMRRLRAGETVDVEAEVRVVAAGEDELGQVGEALDTVRRAALQAAVERAEVLSGVSGVFVNLARRSQVLVHRQLALLDTMERRTEDPAELEDLFRLDHLTTRMRRHAEGLIILSGAAPGRGWRRSVPLLDVVRSAVAEVEEFSRVEVRPLPRVSVLGSAVADLTHLVAELVENATGFSPPHTRVLVSGEQVGAGYALDIEDRGLGMSREAIAEANLRIAEGQQSDLFDSNQLGLFVVSRLARRHGIRVSLRTSPYGGTTAVLLLPMAVLSVEQQPGARPAPVREAERADEVAPAAARRFPERSRGTFAQVRTLNRIASANPNPNPAAGRAATAEPELEAESAHELEPSPAAERSLESAAPVEEELPLRVRQASLAAQLRDVPGRDAPDEGVPEARDAGRSPERVRATMAAMADGWARGRSADLPPGAPDRPGAPGHGDTPARTDDRT